MYRKSLLLALGLLMLTVLRLSAAPVDSRQALAAARQFLTSQGKTATIQAAPMRAPRRAVQSAEAASYYYVFNTEGSRGYVIISGDDRTEQVLGYTDSGTFSEATASAPLLGLLAQYRAEIDALGSGGQTVVEAEPAPPADAAAATTVVEAPRYPIAPLLTTTWNQTAPYNQSCPSYTKDGKTAKCAVGCVGTAFAQVVAYHRYPAATAKEIPSYQSVNDNYNFNQVMPAIPAGTAIDWDNIVDAVYSGSPAEQRTAVADLSFYAACGVRMGFGGASGASTSNGVTLLRDYLGYDSALRYISRSSYTLSDWVKILYNELSHSRPIIYRGSSTGGGHCFVLDGYDGNGLFHVNWGWGGQDNGYFVITSLAPKTNSGAGASTTTDGYSIDCEAIVGIAPQGVGELNLPGTTSGSGEGLTVTDWQVTGKRVKGSKQSVSVTIANNSADKEFYGTLTLVVTAPGKTSGSAASQTGVTVGCQAQTKATFTFTPSEAGEYKLEIKRDGTLLKDKTLLFGTTVASTTVSVAASTGSPNLSIYGTPTELNMTSNIVYGKVRQLTLTVDNNDTKNAFDGNIIVKLYKGELSGGTMYAYMEKSVPLSIPAGRRTTAVARFDDVQTRCKLGVIVTYESGTDLWGTHTAKWTYNQMPGVVVYHDNGLSDSQMPSTTVSVEHAAAVDMRGVTGVKTISFVENDEVLDAAPNPNTLYVMDSRNTTTGTVLSTPSGLDGANVVKDKQIETLSLTDGFYPVYFPCAITAAQARYSVTFFEGMRGAGSWETLLVPFTVSEITVDGEPLAIDGQQLRVRRFAGLDGSGLPVFEDVQQIEGCVPYLIQADASLADREIVMTGTDVTIPQTISRHSVMTSAFDFVGNTVEMGMSEAGYALNFEGTAFEYMSGVMADPFRAVLVTHLPQSRCPEYIYIDADPSGISQIPASDGTARPTPIYNMGGQQVGSTATGLRSLPHGVYVIKGRKVVR